MSDDAGGLRAAFDASMEQPEGITVVAGYLADEDTWKRVERRWNGLLAVAGLELLHLSKIKNRYQDWLKVVEPFAQVIQDARLRSISASLRDTDWKLLDRGSDYLKLCPTRQLACLNMVWDVLADDVRLEFGGRPISVVLDQDYGKPENAVALHTAWCERTGKPSFDLFLKGGVPWDAVPLQCADLLAGVLRMDPFSKGMLDRTLDQYEYGPPDASPAGKLASIAVTNGQELCGRLLLPVT